jgi:hypothetical protein
MSTDFRALCAELLSALIEYDDANPGHDHHVLIRRAETALDQPLAAGPTEDDFHAWWRERWPGAGASRPPYLEQTAMEWAAFCLDRWGRPAAVPVLVSERLPGLEDCNAEGRCWWGYPESGDYACTQWQLKRELDRWGSELAWLPWWALPLPQSHPLEQQP